MPSINPPPNNHIPSPNPKDSREKNNKPTINTMIYPQPTVKGAPPWASATGKHLMLGMGILHPMPMNLKVH